MSLVVEQTLPYTTTELKLEDPKRWSRLFPLIRASVKTVEASNGRVLVVIDKALTESKNVLFTAIGTGGKFSSKILSESHLAAFTTEQSGQSIISAGEIQTILKDNGFPIHNGVVVVRSGSKQVVRTSHKVVEVFLEGESKLNHVLSILSATKPEIKLSLQKTQTLLEHFVDFGVITTSKFHHEKTGSGPSVIHGFDIAEFNSAKLAVDRDLGNLLGSRNSERDELVYSVHYSNINGLSHLESSILAHEISEYLANKKLASHITHSTVVDNNSKARGWAISLCAVPSEFLNPQLKQTRCLNSKSETIVAAEPEEGSSKIQFSDPQVRNIITAGCLRVIQEEPVITEYDTIVGDGDCGYTLRDGAKQVLGFIKKADLSKLPSTLSNLVDDLEINMGGTSGALYCIFLSSLAQNLWEAPNFPTALQMSLDHLLKYTRARLGDRTCLDCLIPFVETLMRTNDPSIALAEAQKGVQRTKQLEAKLGRSSYLDESATRGVPDPGAYGLCMLLEGIVGAQKVSS